MAGCLRQLETSFPNNTEDTQSIINATFICSGNIGAHQSQCCGTVEMLAKSGSQPQTSSSF